MAVTLVPSRCAALPCLALLSCLVLACVKPQGSAKVKGEAAPEGEPAVAGEKAPGQKRDFLDYFKGPDAAAGYGAPIAEEIAADADTARQWSAEDKEHYAKRGPTSQGRSWDDREILRLRDGLVAFDSPKGQELLALAINPGSRSRQRAARDFFTLFRSVETQKNGQFCNVATAVILLNSFHFSYGLSAPVVGRPRSKDVAGKLKYMNGFGLWTQENLFEFTDAGDVRPPQNIIGHGMDLAMYARFLNKLPLKAEHTHAGPEEGREWTPSEGVDAFNAWREKAISNLMTDGDYMIVNYHREPLGQPRGAHYSPLAAYTFDPKAKEDMFLVIDVARFKLPAYWVPAKVLWRGLNTKDSDTTLANRHRGYLEVRADPAFVGL